MIATLADALLTAATGASGALLGHAIARRTTTATPSAALRCVIGVWLWSLARRHRAARRAAYRPRHRLPEHA